MTHYIVVSNQKGGIAKTVNTCLLAHLLASDNHPAAPSRKAHRVLVVDLDLQADATAILTRVDREEFEGASVFEAINTGDAASCIVHITEHLHLLPASAKLAMFDELYARVKNTVSAPEKILERALTPIAHLYDFILVDTAPSLSQLKIQALNVVVNQRTNVLIPLQTKQLGINSVYQFAKTLSSVKQINPALRILGIIPVLTDSNMRVDKSVLQEAREGFGELVFNTVIKRRSGIENMLQEGFSEVKKVHRDALAEFYQLHEEVLRRVEER